MHDQHNRRTFLKHTSAAAMAATTLPAAQALAQSANEKLVVGLIGCGGRGVHDAGLFQRTPQVQLAYVCDVDKQRREAAAKKLGLESSQAVVSDLRKILDDKAVDA